MVIIKCWKIGANLWNGMWKIESHKIENFPEITHKVRNLIWPEKNYIKKLFSDKSFLYPTRKNTRTSVVWFMFSYLEKSGMEQETLLIIIYRY